MTVKVNEQELKKEMAYLSKEDLLYTLKSNVDFLESHNKNYTKEQYYKICELKAFIKSLA